MKKILQIVIIFLMIIGIAIGVSISIFRGIDKTKTENKDYMFYGNLEKKPAEVTKIYTFGTSLNIEGRIKGIKKDNFEGAKIILTNGAQTVEFRPDIDFDDYGIIFKTSKKINKGINLDELNKDEYFIKLRLKLNNCKDYKFYSLSSNKENDNIEYYTLTKNSKNNKINIGFENKKYEEKNYRGLKIKVEESVLPENVYDIVIDAGHGGIDKGAIYQKQNESDLMLDYAKSLKEKLVEKGYKVLLTRDDENTNTYTATNMYNDGGRITLACESNAKIMLSLHLNGPKDLPGVEIYTPCKVDFSFAKTLADSIVNNSSLEYSKYDLFKMQDGVYMKNYNRVMIENSNAAPKDYENYPLTTDTPYIYTIREVGGIATNAYVDGRNTKYNENRYYKSNQGIECYQITLGSIKKDLNTLLNEKESIVNAISECF